MPPKPRKRQRPAKPKHPREGLSPCPRCGGEFTFEQFGERKDGRRNGYCQPCRRAVTRRAGKEGARAASDRPQDERALVVVERYSGFPVDQWATPAAKAWEHARGITLQELWSHRLRTLATRAAVARAKTEKGKEKALQRMRQPMPQRVPFGRVYA